MERETAEHRECRREPLRCFGEVVRCRAIERNVFTFASKPGLFKGNVHCDRDSAKVSKASSASACMRSTNRYGEVSARHTAGTPEV